MARADDVAIVQASIAAAQAGNNSQRITLITMVDSTQYVLWDAPEWFVQLGGGNANAEAWTADELIPQAATRWQPALYAGNIENDDETLDDGNPNEGDDGAAGDDRVARVSADGGVSEVISRRIYNPIQLILDPEQHTQTRGQNPGVKYQRRTIRMPQMIYSRAIQFYLGRCPAAAAVNSFVFGRTKYPVLLGIDINTLGTLRSRTAEQTIRVEPQAN